MSERPTVPFDDSRRGLTAGVGTPADRATLDYVEACILERARYREFIDWLVGLENIGGGVARDTDGRGIRLDDVLGRAEAIHGAQ